MSDDGIRCPDLEKEIQEEKFNALRSALYNGAREGWYAGLHRFVMFISAFGGTAAAANLLRDTSQLQISVWAGFAVAFATTGSLVFDLAGKARTHSALRQRFFAVMGDLEECTSKAALTAIRKRMLLIFGEEPPTKRALDAIAWNQARLSQYPSTQKSDLLRVTTLQYLLGHFWTFPGARFDPSATKITIKSADNPSHPL